MTKAERKQWADLYRRAARRLERIGYGGCCQWLSCEQATSEQNAIFAIYFQPEDERRLPYWWNTPTHLPKNHGPRVLALCFMAAMVEAGDA